MSFIEQVALKDGAGNLIGSNQDVTGGDWHLATCTTQEIYRDVNNTSAVNLSSGATFIGTATNITNFDAVQIMLFTDQPCQVFVDQSQDGTNWDLTDNFIYIVGKPFGVPVQSMNTFVRVRVTNVGPSTTTVFRLTTLLTPITSVLPRALDNLGNLKVSINGLYDQFGFHGQFDQDNNLAVEQPYQLVGAAFIDSTIDTNFWTVANSGAGSGANVGVTTVGIATLTSGTANNGYGKLSSVRLARFVPGQANRHRFYGRLTGLSVANTTRAWGPVTLSTTTPQDGFFFSVDGSNVLSVNSCKAGVVTSVASGSFNGNMNQYIVDTNYHGWEISYTSSAAYFLVDGVLIHTIKATTVSLLNVFDLPINVWCVNSASGTSSAVLQVLNTSIYRLGRPETSPKSNYFSTATTGTTLKIGAGLLHKLIVSNIPANGQVILYDNTAASGTILFDTGGMSGTTQPFFLDFDIPFFTGLEVVIVHNLNVAVVYE